MSYEYIIYVAGFIVGAFFGSFLNLVSDRSVKREQIIKGRSKCDYCGIKLSPRNLIPIVSFLLQSGKCSNCKKNLSYFYPLSEILTGLVFVVSLMYSHISTDFSIQNLIMLVFILGTFCFLIIIFLADAKYQIIPDSVIYLGIIFSLVLVALLYSYELVVYYRQLSADSFGKYLIQAGFWNQALLSYLKSFGVLVGSAFVIALFFLILIVITKGRGMGGGDVKLGFLIGIFNGVPYNLLAIFLGFIIGAIYSTILIVSKKKTLRDTVAFGPFLIIGAFIAFIWGDAIINWYSKLF